MKVDVSIITVGYRSEKTIKPFLDSIRKSRDGLRKEIIVVDNYPSDNGAKIALDHPLKPTVIQNTENVGFSKAINQGIKRSKGDYILVINPDTRIIGNTIKLLHEFAQKTPSLGAVAPKLINQDGSLQPSCSKFPTILNAIKYNFFGCKNCFKKYAPKSTAVVDVAVMAAFMIPRAVINEVGGLDERFFLYYEDIEYCRRLKKYHFLVYYYPVAKVGHIHGASGNFASHLKSPLLSSAKIYHGAVYSFILNLTLWLGHKWQVILKGRRFKD